MTTVAQPAGQQMTPGVTFIRIAITDDHPIFRDGLRRMLAMEDDFQVVAEAKDGAEVVEVLNSQKPDILLLDLKMPGLDGLSVLQQIQHSDYPTKVIVLTASEDKNQFVQAMKFGASGIVLKATLTKTLITGIRAVHSGGIWLDAHTASAVMGHFPNSDGAEASRERPLLSAREHEIVCLVAQAWRNKEIAERMFMREQTVKNHLHTIYDKLGIDSRLGLALYAIENKWVDGPDPGNGR